jgi:hypothetical protein
MQKRRFNFWNGSQQKRRNKKARPVPLTPDERGPDERLNEMKNQHQAGAKSSQRLVTKQAINGTEKPRATGAGYNDFASVPPDSKGTSTHPFHMIAQHCLGTLPEKGDERLELLRALAAWLTPQHQWHSLVTAELEKSMNGRGSFPTRTIDPSRSAVLNLPDLRLIDDSLLGLEMAEDMARSLFFLLQSHLVLALVKPGMVADEGEAAGLGRMADAITAKLSKHRGDLWHLQQALREQIEHHAPGKVAEYLAQHAAEKDGAR